MNHTSYLFFDCECANCFDGEGKICSLGYVLTDDEFNIIEKEDVVINPKCDFDWYILSPKNKCQLAYSKDYFRIQPDFAAYYKDIKKLFTTGNRKIFGFAVDGDVSFINTACERAGVDYIQFAAMDIKPALENEFKEKMKLAEWCDYLKIDVSGFKAHRSVDDAEMTMLCCKALCEKLGITGDELYAKMHENVYSWDYMLDVMEERRIKKEFKAKIEKMMNKKNPFPAKCSITGKQVEIDRNIMHDPESAYEIVKKIYDHGGMIVNKLNNNGYFIIQSHIPSNVRQKYESRNNKVLTLDELDEVL